MRIGIGLPTTIRGADGALLLDWARRADAGPFSSLGVLDRVVYQAYEPLTALAAAAGVTTRVKLVSMVVIGPIRNTTLLAQQAASLDAISGGRLVVGLGIGARHEDYRACGVDPATRGPDLSTQLLRLRELWEGDEIGPRPSRSGGPEMLVGGASGPALLRMARYADGYVHAGGPPRSFEGAAARARAAWVDAGRPGDPQLWGQAYFALRDAEKGAGYLRDYYAFTGAFAEKVAAANLTSPAALRDHLRGYEDAGCDELVLFPTVSDPAELDRLADIIS